MKDTKRHEEAMQDLSELQSDTVKATILQRANRAFVLFELFCESLGVDQHDPTAWKKLHQQFYDANKQFHEITNITKNETNEI